MNDRPTPRTDAVARVMIDGISPEYIVRADFARTIERELAELRELYDLDTQTLRAERDEARDALRVRIKYNICPECDAWCQDDMSHKETCRHYAVEQEVMQ